MEKEIWKDILWYEGLYQVSNLGKVKSLIRWKERIIKSSLYKWYYRYSLYKNWKGKKYQWHRLLASAFLWLDLYSFQDMKTSMCVCHKNDNRSDNRLENLFLWTHKDNMEDRDRKWRNWIKWKFWKYNPSSKEVFQYTKEGVFIKSFWAVREATRLTWIHKWQISYCCRWKLKSAWWYVWSYLILE